MPDKVTLVVFSGELDKVLAAFNIAVGAASSGMEVSMFFTFWGLNIIKKNEGPIRSRGIMRKMLNFMNRGGAKRLPLSKFNMFGLGKWMMMKLMKDARTPSLDEMIELAAGMGVKFMACTTSMGMMGISKEALIPQVGSYCGVATYLSEARDSKINLFI
ncbi:MAG: DsrE/DsrF/DrsH-like family protein [Dehalococcoidia bacterium]|nr:DsrE/DsrF/DrsH-like family protein [Dehalococcoidia bacterium]